MHSGFEIPGVHHQHQHQQGGEITCTPVLMSMNQTTNILDQIPTQHLFLDHHFLAHHNRHYLAGAGPDFPVNFKLGLNEVCTSTTDYKDHGDGAAGGGDASAALLRGSEEYQVPEARHASSLGMLHCWQNQEDSAIKPQPLWEPLPAEVSNENSEIVDRQDMNQKDATACLDSKGRVHFSELEAIYKRLGNQTPPNKNNESEADEEPAAAADKKKKRKKKKKNKREETGYNNLITPMMEFFRDLVKKVMDHQENLHKKFADVIERLDEERRTREEAWRNEEMVHFQQEAAARARERALSETREAMIVSYLEKITGHNITLPSFNPQDNPNTKI